MFSATRPANPPAIGARASGFPPRAACRLATLALVVATLLAPIRSAAAFPEPPYLGPPEGFEAAETAHLRFFVAANSGTDAEAFALAYGDPAERAYDEIRALLGVAPEGKLPITVYADDAAFGAAVARTSPPEAITAVAVGNGAAGTVAVALGPLLASRSPIEAENALRHAIAHVLVGYVASDRLPRGFAEGIAQYVERPLTARQARYAALLQSANQRADLLSWSDLNRPQAPGGDPDLVAAHTYSIVAFLVDRHGLRRLRDFVTALPAEPDWRSAMRTVYDRSPTEIEDQWRENLPRWTAGGWRTNLFAAFDLQPANDLLATAHYAAANDALERSLRLYTELDDPARVAEVSALLRQGEIGIQAEALMGQVQEALERHTYDRAQTLVAQADGQFAQLPATQRPAALLATYAALAADGLAASTTLEAAQRRSRRWADYPAARADALAAGTTFARLGDEEMTQRTDGVLSELDVRQRRLVLMLGALAALTIAWLVLWLWARGPPELTW